MHRHLRSIGLSELASDTLSETLPSSKKSNANLEVSDTDDDAAILKDCYVAILSLGKGGVVEISDVTLKKK